MSINASIIIARHGKPITIKRTTDVSTYGYIQPIKVTDMQSRYNFLELLVLPTSTVVAGDVVYDGTDYFLVSVLKDMCQGGIVAYKKAILLISNVSVTIQRLTGGALTTVKSGVRCLITKSKIMAQDDDSLYRDKATGDKQVNYVYCAASEDIRAGDYLTAGSATLKVLDDISPYVAAGILEIQAAASE